MSRESNWESKAQRVMSTVMSHPGAIPFMIPPIVGDDFPHDYFKIIKSPMDFTTISASLASHKYQTVTDWRSDINLVFDNAHRYYRDGLIVKLGQAIQAVFEKSYAKEFDYLTVEDWWRKVMKLSHRVQQLSSLTSQFPVSKKELKAFIKAAGKLTKPEDHERLLTLLKKEEPEMSFGTGEVNVDLRLLKPSTIRLAHAFIRESLAAEGISM
jgi:hypothetical protein